jgi:hypothetical protein
MPERRDPYEPCESKQAARSFGTKVAAHRDLVARSHTSINFSTAIHKENL